MESVAGEEMIIMPLGGGQEVGRSCILLQYQNRNIMLDCGCHPGREGDGSLPFFDSLSDPAEIDLILITHFHIDHCAALPYFTERTEFKGKIYMTHPTKAVMKLLLSDNIRLQSKQGLYNEQVGIHSLLRLRCILQPRTHFLFYTFEYYRIYKIVSIKSMLLTITKQ